MSTQPHGAPAKPSDERRKDMYNWYYKGTSITPPSFLTCMGVRQTSVSSPDTFLLPLVLDKTRLLVTPIIGELISILAHRKYCLPVQ